MKKILLLPLVCIVISASAQQEAAGNVLEKDTGLPIAGITVGTSQSKNVAVTDQNGYFSIAVSEKDKLTFTGKTVSHQVVALRLPLQKPLLIYLTPAITEIEEVILSTGYQKISKERATGSFSVVGQKELNQIVTTNVMDRLPVFANGMALAQGLSENGQLMVRGLSTLQGPKNPLIILDNFPYEGDLSNINPNIVENITVLKDAAASSIWGARAANGVIVITTRNTKRNQPVTVEVTANTTLAPKPDLSYARQMSASDFIDVETQLFNNGRYDDDINSPNHPVLTPVVDLLYKEKLGQVSADDLARELSRLRGVDVRDQYRRYMYVPMENRQYAINMAGAGQSYAWSSFAGLDDNTGNLDDKYRRINIRLQNTYKPTDKVTLSASIYFTNTNSKSGRNAYNSISMNNNWNIPYMEFADSRGNPLVMNSVYNQDYKNSLQGLGLLDWNYYPLTDWQHNRTEVKNTEVIMDAGLNYKFLKGLDVDIKYQYQNLNGSSNAVADENSYSTRLLINSFAQASPGGTVTFIIPKGGILDKSSSRANVNNLRGQLNFDRLFGRHAVNVLLGSEMRKTINYYDSDRYYGYNPSTLAVASVDYTHQYPNFVSGDNAFIINNTSLHQKTTNYLSYYANGSYTFDNRYVVTGSLRQDASNLFGLNTNDQWNPFWSAGLAWNLSNEKYYRSTLVPLLKLRASYGFNGNIDPAMVAITTIRYDPGVLVYTGSPTARIDNYFNPNLKWEMIRMINVGLDFGSKDDRIAGSLELYTKKGSNLFGTAPVDYTTGISSLLWNVAGIKGKGIDVQLRSKNIDRNFKWDTTVNFSTYKDQVTNYYLPTTFASDFISQAGSVPPVSGIVGMPVYSVFAYRWAGLDPATGEPQGYLNGEISKNYTEIMASDKGIEDLQYFGSALPTKFGSVINSFRYRQLYLDVGITYKLGYWFRRSSVNYTNLITDFNGHSDFAKRWQKPGDESVTDIPSFQGTADYARDAFYNGSAALVEKGDHVRLQYITMGYQISKSNFFGLPFKNLQMFCSVNNLGILWKANNAGLDPDYSWGTYSLKPVTTISFGLKTQF